VDPLSLDDSSGEGIGDGFDASSLGLSGTDAFSLDFAGEVPLQGSDVALDFTAGSVFAGGATDLPSNPNLYHDVNLSGVSDPAPDGSSLDTGISLNGAGSAPSSYSSQMTTSSDISSVSNLFAGFSKFGASLGGLLTSQGSPARATVGMPIANGNPNRSVPPTSISGSHATLLVVIAIILVAVLYAGGE
jgi:hypothetical protein